MPTFCIAVSRDTAIICFLLRRANQANPLPATYLDHRLLMVTDGDDNADWDDGGGVPSQAKYQRSYNVEPGHSRIEISASKLAGLRGIYVLYQISIQGNSVGSKEAMMTAMRFFFL